MSEYDEILHWAEGQGIDVPPPAVVHMLQADADTPLEAFACTDLGNGERLVAQHGPNLRYCWQWNKWLAFDGKRWSQDIPEEIHKLCALTVRAMYKRAQDLIAEIEATTQGAVEFDPLALKPSPEAKARQEKFDIAVALLKYARASESKTKLEAMASTARPYLSIKPNDLDQDFELINCLNGTLHLPSGELRPHRREDFMTKMMPVEYHLNYDPDCRWMRFLDDALPDENVRRYVQKLVGYSLRGGADKDVVILCHGPGGTGKTTFCEALRSVFGEYGASAEIGTFTTKRDAHAPQPDLARLAGKRLVTVAEAQESGGIVALLKAVSGDDTIPTRSHYQETWEFQPTFTLWLRSNKRPKVPDDDSGLWRRLKEIPFVQQFANPDDSIRKTLKNPAISGPDILAWAVKGYQLMLTEGLEAPEEVSEATSAYKAEMDPLADWLEDSTVTVPDAWTSSKDLFDSYKKWAEANGVRAMGSKGLSRRLSLRFTPFNRGPKGGRGFAGIGLLADFDDINTSAAPSVYKNDHFVSELTLGGHFGTQNGGSSLARAHIREVPATEELQVLTDTEIGSPSVYGPPNDNNLGKNTNPSCRCSLGLEAINQGPDYPKCANCGFRRWCPTCGGCRGCILITEEVARHD